MLVIERSSSVLNMSPNNKPAARAKDGDTVVFETFDCFSNQIRSNDQLFSSVGWDKINPATGPLFVEGADVGDILRVEILDIELDSQGVMTIAPKLGALGEFIDAEVTRIVPLVNGKAVFSDVLSLDLSPMIGVIGTAPKTEEIPTGTPGEHGGNMDNKRIGKGALVYLPVNVTGGMLSMGDMHAVMGDGEIVLCGVEVCGRITVKVDVIKGKDVPLPLVVRDGDLMAVASAKTLDEAAKMAVKNMFLFLRQELKMGIDEAGMLLSIAGDLRICQIVDPLMTARMELPLWILEKYGYKMF